MQQQAAATASRMVVRTMTKMTMTTTRAAAWRVSTVVPCGLQEIYQQQPQQHRLQFSTKATTAPLAAVSTTTTTSAATSIIVPQVLPSPENREAPLKGFLVDMFDQYSPANVHHRKQVAEQMFQAARRQAFDPIWFGPGRIPRDFRNRHAMLTMHVWFLNKRLISDTYDKPFAHSVQDELFDILWDDTRSRIRAARIEEMLVYKNLLKVQQYTIAHLTHYDYIYTTFLDKPTDRFKELKRLLARHVLLTEDDKPILNSEEKGDVVGDEVFTKLVHSKLDSQMDRLAWYVDAQYQNICLEWPEEHYREGRVAWIQPPDFQGLKDAKGNVLPENPAHPADTLPKPWLFNITLKGEEYYWNPETRQSLWSRPTTTTTH